MWWLFKAFAIWCVFSVDSTFLLEPATLRVWLLAAMSGQCESQASCGRGWHVPQLGTLQDTFSWANHRNLGLGSKGRADAPRCQLSRTSALPAEEGPQWKQERGKRQREESGGWKPFMGSEILRIRVMRPGLWAVREEDDRPRQNRERKRGFATAESGGRGLLTSGLLRDDPVCPGLTEPAKGGRSHQPLGESRVGEMKGMPLSNSGGREGAGEARPNCPVSALS